MRLRRGDGRVRAEHGREVVGADERVGGDAERVLVPEPLSLAQEARGEVAHPQIVDERRGGEIGDAARASHRAEQHAHRHRRRRERMCVEL